MNRFLILCNECEHSGDLDRFADDMHRAGFKVIGQRITPYEYETGELTVTHPATSLSDVQRAIDASDAHGLCFVSGRAD